MRLSFRATDGGFIDDDDGIGFSFGAIDEEGREHYLNLQRSVENDPEEDSGIYLEFDDQCNAGYECLERCWLSREMLTIDLRKPLGKWLIEIKGFDVSLGDISDQTYEELRTGLPRAFRGCEDRLERIAITN